MRIPATKLGIARLIALILLGAIPATFLCFFSVVLALVGSDLFLTNGDFENLAVALWGAMGVFGTYSLWRICFGYLSTVAYVGLVFGILAAIAAPIVFGWDRNDYGSSLVSGLPVLVALYLLGELVYRTRKFAQREQLSSVDDVDA